MLLFRPLPPKNSSIHTCITFTSASLRNFWIGASFQCCCSAAECMISVFLEAGSPSLDLDSAALDRSLVRSCVKSLFFFFLCSSGSRLRFATHLMFEVPIATQPSYRSSNLHKTRSWFASFEYLTSAESWSLRTPHLSFLSNTKSIRTLCPHFARLTWSLSSLCFLCMRALVFYTVDHWCACLL